MKTTLHSDGVTFVVEYTQSRDEYEAKVNGQTRRVRLLSARDEALTLLVDGQSLRVHLASDGQRTLVAIEGQVYEFTQAQKHQARPHSYFLRQSQQPALELRCSPRAGGGSHKTAPFFPAR